MSSGSTTPGLATSGLTPPDKRRRALEIARRAFAEKGYDAAAVADIASEAGVAVGTLYNWFGDKSELLDAVLKEVERDLLMVFADPDVHRRPFAERLQPLFDGLMREAARRPDLPGLFAVAARRSSPETGTLAKAFAALIDAGVKAGQFRFVDVAAASALLAGAVEGAMRALTIKDAAGKDASGDPKRWARSLTEAARLWLVPGAAQDASADVQPDVTSDTRAA